MDTIITHIETVYRYLDSDQAPTVSFIAPTGSGKTIGMALYLFLRGKRMMIVCPKTISALGAAQYMIELADKLNLPEHPRIGYAAGNLHHYDSSSDIIFVTAGHFYKKMMTLYPDYHEGFVTMMFDGLDYLIMDDAHITSLDYSLIELIMKYAIDVRREQGYIVPQVLLMSAVDFTYADFRNNLELSYLADVDMPIVNALVAGQYPVEIVYTPPRAPSIRVLIDTIYNLIRNILPGGIDNMRVERQVINVGDVCLVFLPGRMEIDLLSSRLNDVDLVEVRRLHSGILEMTKVTVISVPNPSKVVVILATPIAETSITIDRLAVVIDTMREKILVSDYEGSGDAGRNGGNVLRVRPITKNSALQRLGRLGRVMVGTCYRVITDKDYSKLPQHRAGELQRINLQPLLVEFISNSIPLDVLKTVNYHPEIEDMFKKEIITVEGTTVKLTEYGQFGVGFALSPRSCKILCLCNKDPLLSAYMYECIVIMTVVEEGQYFKKLTNEALANAISSFGPTSPYESKSDLHSNVALLIEYLSKMKTLRITANKISESSSWLLDNSVSERRMDNTLTKIRETVTAYGSRYHQVKFGIPQWRIENQLAVDLLIRKMIASDCYELIQPDIKITPWFNEGRPPTGKIILSLSGVREGVASFTAFI